MSGISARKAHHIELCATADVGFRARTTLLEQVRFVHNALPDVSIDEIDLGCNFLGKRLRAPILIAAMTGGTDEAGAINRELAQIAEERGYAFGLGSQRAMHVTPEARGTYWVRDVAPTVPILGNVGLVQAGKMATRDLAALVSQVGADGICIHLNPAQELVQNGGDRDFRGGTEIIARVVRELDVPVIVKETGCGISGAVGARLRKVGVRHVDVSGAGGTSWVAVETLRATDEPTRNLGEAFWDWGIPTGASVAQLAPLGFDTLIATGGIATGLDIARAVALGATCAGIARPVLRAFREGGRARAIAFFEQLEAELRGVLLLTGSRDLEGLRRARRMISGELGEWVESAKHMHGSSGER